MGRLVDIDKRFNVMSLYGAFYFPFKDSGFEISFYTPKDHFSYACPDLCIIRGKHIYAAIYRDNEIEDNINVLTQTEEVFKKLGIRFIILQNSKESYKLCDLSGKIGYGTFIVVDMDDIKNIFIHLENQKYKLSQDYAEKFKNAFTKKIKDIGRIYGHSWDNEEELLNCFAEESSFDSITADDYGCYLNDKDAEDGIFLNLIDMHGTGKRLCRYSSLQSLFRIINDKEQSMCCLVGMNDESETNYVDSYLGLNDKETSYNPQTENQFFILSLLPEEKRDDLTMWRLYGNDTAGICIEYEVEPLNKSDKFNLFEINYGIDKNHHPALDFIRELLNIEIEGKKFYLRRLNEWKHFFKSYEYKDEHEIRLLYKANIKENKTKWILTNDYNIITPLKLFDIDGFPLKVKNIILGPNCPCKETNKIQIEQMIFDTDFPIANSQNGEIVKVSNCISYRK